jgi:hypothetical protein
VTRILTLAAFLLVTLSTPRSAAVIPDHSGNRDPDQRLSGAPKLASPETGPREASGTSADVHQPTGSRLGASTHPAGVGGPASSPPTALGTGTPGAVARSMPDSRNHPVISPVAIPHAQRRLATPKLAAIPHPDASACLSPCFVRVNVPTWGVASWYSDHGRAGFYAAIPGWDGTPVNAVVCTFPDGRSNCATVVIADSCQCFVGTAWERQIDLSPAAFAWFAPLSAGIVRVQVQVLR